MNQHKATPTTTTAVHTLPFWLGHEDEEHVGYVMRSYERALGMGTFYGEAESLFPRGENNIPLFIGKIIRRVLLVRPEDDAMETMDEVHIYYRDMFVRRGACMPFFKSLYTRTVWNMTDGIPTHLQVCGSSEFKYLSKFCDSKRTMVQPFCLYAFPQFCHYSQNSYKSVIGMTNLIVSYGCLVDSCVEKIDFKQYRKRHFRSRSSKDYNEEYYEEYEEEYDEEDEFEELMLDEGYSQDADPSIVDIIDEQSLMTDQPKDHEEEAPSYTIRLFGLYDADNEDTSSHETYMRSLLNSSNYENTSAGDDSPSDDDDVEGCADSLFSEPTFSWFEPSSGNEEIDYLEEKNFPEETNKRLNQSQPLTYPQRHHHRTDTPTTIDANQSSILCI